MEKFIKNLHKLFFRIQALSILTTYMTSSPISPLQQRFVELPQPLATDVDANILLNSEAAVTVDFGNVPIDKMEEIDGMFKAFMHDIMNKGSEFWDMERMHNISEYRNISTKPIRDLGPTLEN